MIPLRVAFVRCSVIATRYITNQHMLEIDWCVCSWRMYRSFWIKNTFGLEIYLDFFPQWTSMASKPFLVLTNEASLGQRVNVIRELWDLWSRTWVYSILFGKTLTLALSVKNFNAIYRTKQKCVFPGCFHLLASVTECWDQNFNTFIIYEPMRTMAN